MVVNIAKITNDVTGDVLKSGVAMTVIQWLSRQALTDLDWQTNLVYTLIGRAVYQGIVKPLSATGRFGRYQGLADDILREMTTSLVVELLAGGDFGPIWWIGLMSSIAGLALFHFYISRLITPPGNQWCKPGYVNATVSDALKHAVLNLTNAFLITGNFGPDAVDSYLHKIAGFTTYNVGVAPILDTIRN